MKEFKVGIWIQEIQEKTEVPGSMVTGEPQMVSVQRATSPDWNKSEGYWCQGWGNLYRT